jgi:hypothetical protein
MKTVYKIRRKSDGLFSTGGMSPHFNEKGKIWNQRGHVSNHMANFRKSELDRFYGNCEVVLYQVEETELETLPATEWKVTKETARAKELQEQRRREYMIEYKKREIKRLEQQLEVLKK